MKLEEGITNNYINLDSKEINHN